MQQLIEGLGSRGEKILAENLSEGEEVKVKVKGSFGEALVITNKRLYVPKWGFMTGSTLGGRCNAFDFAHVTSIELKKGLTSGTVEILTAATHNIRANWWKTETAHSDNIIRFGADKFKEFEEAVRIGREAVREDRTHGVGGGTKKSYLDELENLSQLKGKGIITEEIIKKEKTINIDSGSLRRMRRGFPAYGDLILTSTRLYIEPLVLGWFGRVKKDEEISIPIEDIVSVKAVYKLIGAGENLVVLFQKDGKEMEIAFGHPSFGELVLPNPHLQDRFFAPWVEAIEDLRQKVREGKKEGSGFNELEKLAELKEKGIITEEEFNAKKKQILGL